MEVSGIRVSGRRKSDQDSQVKHGYFVTGTDTGIGKTLVSTALVHGFVQRGYAVAGMKPVAAGCINEAGSLISDDVKSLQEASNVGLSAAIANPYAFEPPLAPHIAADLVGRAIELEIIEAAFLEARSQVDVLVVEGVGGFRVPLNSTQDTGDLAVMLGLPVILVVGMRLGCLSHALLSVEAIAARQLTLAGWVANCIDPDMAALEENLTTLDRLINAPRLGTLTFQPHPDYRSASDCLNIAALAR